MRKIIRLIVATLAALGLSGAVVSNAAAYPGPDGYDSGYCYAVTGMKMGASNWFSGTGQIVAIDVNDTTSSDSIRRVQWSSTIATFTATTGLARVEIYRASKTEAPILTLYTNGGKSCSLRLDGSM